MASRSRLVPEFTMATTAELSHCARTVLPAHSLPHRAAARTMGRSSFTVIFCSLMAPIPAHFSWNHSLPFIAPHPHEPDASEIMETSNSGCPLLTDDIIAIPFHSEQYRYHHSMSERAEAPSRTNRCRGFTVVERSMSRRRNYRPARTALHAWLREPMRASSSLFLHTFLPRHASNEAFNCWSFVWGRRISSASVSSSIPRNPICVAGPSSFSGSIYI